METTVELEIFSPRWGHTDTYRVHMTRDYMEIKMQVRSCRATYSENLDPQWSGELIESIMNNDMIYPPAITQDLFERAWLAWRNGELDDQDVAKELQAVAEWINTVTEAKPNTDFWKSYF